MMRDVEIQTSPSPSPAGAGRILCLGINLLLAAGCQGIPGPRSHALNPFGWPARLVGGIGYLASDTGIPLVRESGRLMASTSELIDVPAVVIEGVVGFSATRLELAARQGITGTGGALTATINLATCWAVGFNVDLGRDADAVNDALAYIEHLEPNDWRYYPGDQRTDVFPPGTRVIASGSRLIWILPNLNGDATIDPNPLHMIQEAQSSVAMALFVPKEFIAQERTWGFAVASADAWSVLPDRERAVTIIHEFYHQYHQLRGAFLGWSLAYWPAYGYSFALHGWDGHWAEKAGANAAWTVDHALRGWQPRTRATTEDRPLSKRNFKQR